VRVFVYHKEVQVMHGHSAPVMSSVSFLDLTVRIQTVTWFILYSLEYKLIKIICYNSLRSLASDGLEVR
jgi:hypothetical protein